MMKSTYTLVILTLLLFVSCAEESQHDLTLESSYTPFSKAMSISKTLVQEVLVAAYQNPDLIGFTEDISTNRSDCPSQEDLNPDEFPKTLIFSYSSGCTTDSNNDIIGDLEVYVSNKIGVDGMEIILTPRSNFSINGDQLSLNGSSAEFKSTYTGSANGDDNYFLSISGLDIITANEQVYQIQNMENGTIYFRDVEGNNGSSSSPVNYFDDLAIIDFQKMTFLNNDNKKMEATLALPLSFDLFCKCPLEGKVEVRSEDNNSQIIDFTTNSNCGGYILVDVEEINCKN